MAVRQSGSFCFQVEGEVQAGEYSPVGQSVGLVIFLAAALLKGYIWHRQRRTCGHSAAGVRTGAGIGSGIRIQEDLSFDGSLDS